MFIILLRFAENKPRAKEFMDGHNAWIKRGLDDGAFLLVGSLQPNAGGAILAIAASPDDLRRRVEDDPFVAEKVVTAEILEITPNKTDPRLAFLAD
ncbi:MAG TPA: hypothetical protein DC046_09285 [Rhodospirillaceae bacterium]|nr:hypothetical protein [Rhodospirillaceae bacterium]